MAKKKIMVISLGGSMIIPDKPNYKFLKDFKATLKRHYKTHKFVVVCGGGPIARKYISSLREEGKSTKELSLAGIMATRMNARFMAQLFGKESNSKLPKTMKEVKSDLAKNKVVFCGALRYAPDSTSDGTAAKLARLFDTEFINITNIKGLYTANPKTHPKAKFIPKVTWKKFDQMAHRSKYKAGQHFVLDQQAAIIIRKEKIKTYIIGTDIKNLSRVLSKKKFTGTLVSG